MNADSLDLNLATFVGIDAHQEEHTACAVNRFEEEKGILRFENSQKGIKRFLGWLLAVDLEKGKVVVGIEGGGNARHALVANLVNHYQHVFEVNPLYTKQRRSFGTRPDKSDAIDAKAIAEVLTRKLEELPQITKGEYSAQRLCLRKTVWFYEETTCRGSKLKTQLKQLERERSLSPTAEERQLLSLIVREKKKEIRRIKRLQSRLKKKLAIMIEEQGKNLTTVKGIDTILAAKIMAHANGIERFSRIDAFVRYAGIAPLEKSSGKSRRFRKNKRGNRKLNSTFYLIAVGQLKWNPKAKEYWTKKIKEGKTKKQAIRCLMKRIACIVYGMLKNGQNYRVN